MPPTGKRRSFGYYAVRAVRVSGWFLLALMVLYIVTGWALGGVFGLDRVMSEKTATDLHVNWKLDRLLIVLLAVHVGAAAYLALRRKRWI